MPSIIQRRLSQCGLSRQSTQGTAATAATYAYGVDGGSIFKLELTENEIPLTWSNLDILAYDRSGVKPQQDIGTLGTPNLLGLLLLGALGSDAVTSPPAATTLSAAATAGAVQISVPVSYPAGTPILIGTGATQEQHVTVGTPTGSGPYLTTINTGLANAQASGLAVTPNGYTHVLTPAPTLPYMTAWGQFGTADWVQVIDSKVSSLEMAWEEAGRLSVKHMLAGVTPKMLASQFAITNLEVPSGVGYFTAGGGVFNIEGVPFATTGGSIKIDTHIDQPITAATVLPADVIEGKREISWSIKILPTDTGLFREVYYGTKAAGALSGITPFPHLGAINYQFPSPGGSLQIASPETRFMVDFPESSPDGGPAELTLTGTSTLPLTGSTITATAINQVPSY